MTEPVIYVLQMYAVVLAQAILHGTFIGICLVAVRGLTGLKKRRRISGLDTLV